MYVSLIGYTLGIALINHIHYSLNYMHTKYGLPFSPPCRPPSITGLHFFWQAHILPCTMSCIGTFFGDPTQNHKCTLLIPSKHIIINNDKQRANMETTVRRSHRMKYSLFIQDLIQVCWSLFQDSCQIDQNKFPIE